MITAVVGAGGKTSLIHLLAEAYRAEGKKVFVTTTTHMFAEEETLLVDENTLPVDAEKGTAKKDILPVDAENGAVADGILSVQKDTRFEADGTLLKAQVEEIIRQLEENGYVMAGVPCGEKISALPKDIYLEICSHADEVLVEADGSKHFPIKYPNETEPVIPENTEKIIVVAGLHALGKPAKDAAFRLELVKQCLDISDDTVITPTHVQQLVRKGYVERLMEQSMEQNTERRMEQNTEQHKENTIEQNTEQKRSIEICATHDGSLYQRALAALMKADMDVSLIKEEWFAPKPVLLICGGGHVAKELAEFASKLDYRVRVMDPRTEFANRERFPGVEEIICDSFDNLDKYVVPGGYYTVVTSGHKGDYICVRKILDSKYRYLGMIGSRGKVANTFARLTEEGITDEQIQSIHAPIGLPIGAVTPGEIAVSILAEIIQEKNRSGSSSVSTELLESSKSGVLCIIIEKTGSAPRGVGSMMLVTEDGQMDSIGGGPIENAAILDARKDPSACIRHYQLGNQEGAKLGMICGGTCNVLFLPI